MLKFTSYNFLIIVILSIAVTSIQAQQQNEKLKVLVLYESLCPDSLRFMRDQLGPNYDDLKNMIDIAFVPFGKSQSKNNGAEFFCQHGPAECEGNRMQSCVLEQTTNQEKQTNFVVCQMTTEDTASIKDCAESAGLSSDIETCMKTELGTYMQLRAERITQTYQPTFVPTIIYNGVFNQRVQDSSLHDFRGTVCSLLQQRGSISFHNPACQ